MISRKEDRIEHLGTTIFFVLCFFLLTAFHQNLNNPNVTGAFQCQITTQYTFAVLSKDIPQLSSLQGFISLLDEINFKHISEQLKISWMIQTHLFSPVNSISISLISTVNETQ